MPVGVPKVPFRIPGEEDATWVDLNRLHRERFLFIGQEIDSEISNHIVGLIVYLAIEDNTRDQFLFINSPGGSVIPGIAVYDAMHFVIPKVYTICIGLAASMASFVLLGGEIPQRLALPHARVMIHQPASSFIDSQTGEFFMEVEEIMKFREIMTNIYVQRTHNPSWVISLDMERDVFMSATEAKAHGIVDLVGILFENENEGNNGSIPSGGK
uniref:ATP-dependent Clp protease proteolytic subunit n=1 Tax=Trillium maculatum TaxID=82490 RepID=A0A0K1L5J5_TRIMC|nr:clp protease proteolytic subunit [Trillium maculatum]AKU36932.1 clp protease proteolytic subunit [Trillium maculatum]